MCGLTGFFEPQGFPRETATGLIRQMSVRLAHRGPDDEGVWVDGDAGIALGHRRLSILDLSAAGHQPMVSPGGRYVIVLNGEIYNHLELRAFLGGANISWRGHSDTETILAGFEYWGIELTIRKSVGMFALAVWDRHQRVLTLCRDRMGEKPLYYGWQGSTFLFGSELKSMRAHPAFRKEIDRTAIPLYLRHGYVPAPYSIFQGIRKLLPGTFLQVAGSVDVGFLPEPVPYWSLRAVVEVARGDPFAGTDSDAIEELDALLKQAVSLQRLADVPLGAFLSGGIDSSLIVALMQSQSTERVKTFTIGFHEEGYNEAEYAKAVARHLGTDHSELYVTANEAMEVIPSLPGRFDEPFGDSSAIPTILVSRLARQRVTVSLSGDGGDELFGGYDRYQGTQHLWSAIGRVPRTARQLLAGGISMLPVVGLNRLSASLGCRRNRQPLGEKASRLATLLSADSMEMFYHIQQSQWKDSAESMAQRSAAPPARSRAFDHNIDGAMYDKMMFADSLGFLPDDILVKVDRSAMSVGLETRVPLLDYRVVEFSWRVPLHMKIRHGKGKWLMRQVLSRYVPEVLFERPKKGFGVPVDHWVRGPLREWAEDLLSEQRLRTDGLLRPERIRQRWNEHLGGKQNWRDSLWLMLSFQAWIAEQ